MALTKVPSNLDSITATTQSQGDGSTNVATTAYVDTGLANLIDSAPGNLNTLNELAAAMNDNASFFSTVLPLSGGTLTGALTGTTAAFNSGATNTVATFTSTDTGAGVQLTDSTGSSKLETSGANLRVSVDDDGAVASSAIQFRVDGSTKTTIDSDGHVGIGIAPVPGASGKRTLHLHSEADSAYLRLTQSSSGSTATDGFDLISGGTEAYVWNREDGNIRFGVDNAEKMRLTDDGELQLGTSIGNSTYAGQFNSVANLGSSGANIQTRNGNGNKHYILRGDNNVEYGSIGLTSATGTGVFQLQGESGIAFRGASASDKMRLDTNGKLIIGDTQSSAADDLLQIETPASGGGHGIQIRRNDSNGDQGIGRIMFGNNNDIDLATIQATTDGQADSARLAIFTQKTSGNSTERMRVQSNGGIRLTGNHQYNFRASGASNPGNGATIVFDEVKAGNGASCYNTSNGYYEAAIYGWYLFSVGIRYDTFGSTSGAYVRPQFAYLANGGSSWLYPHQGGWVDPIFGVDIGNGTYLSISYTVPILLSVGDSVRVVNNGNVSNTVNHNESHFGGIFMG